MSKLLRASFSRCVVTGRSGESLQQGLADAVQSLQSERGWRIRAKTVEQVSLRVPGSFESWGEEIQLQLKGTAVLITSKCRFPLQLIDWGKNRKNVESAEYAVQRSLA